FLIERRQRTVAGIVPGPQTFKDGVGRLRRARAVSTPDLSRSIALSRVFAQQEGASHIVPLSPRFGAIGQGEGDRALRIAEGVLNRDAQSRKIVSTAVGPFAELRELTPACCDAIRQGLDRTPGIRLFQPMRTADLGNCPEPSRLRAMHLVG